jgi:hypothetical protein
MTTYDEAVRRAMMAAAEACKAANPTPPLDYEALERNRRAIEENRRARAMIDDELYRVDVSSEEFYENGPRPHPRSP